MRLRLIALTLAMVELTLQSPSAWAKFGASLQRNGMVYFQNWDAPK